jgi:hypothetical protein
VAQPLEQQAQGGRPQGASILEKGLGGFPNGVEPPELTNIEIDRQTDRHERAHGHGNEPLGTTKGESGISISFLTWAVLHEVTYVKCSYIKNQISQTIIAVM